MIDSLSRYSRKHITVRLAQCLAAGRLNAGWVAALLCAGCISKAPETPSVAKSTPRGELPAAAPRKPMRELSLWKEPPVPLSQSISTVNYPVRRTLLDNGLRVVVVPRPESESVAVVLQIPQAGGLPGGPLTALGEALRAGSTTRLGERIYDPRINDRAIQVLSSWWSTELTWYLLPSAKWKALELLADFVQRPVFEPQLAMRYIDATYEESRRDGREWHLDLRAVAGLPHGAPWVPFAERTRRVYDVPPKAYGALHDCTFRPVGATLVLVGKLDPEEALQRARHLFGGWKRAAADRSQCQANESRALKRHEAMPLKRPNIEEADGGREDPRFVIAFEGPGPRSPDFFAFEALTELVRAKQSSEQSALRHAGQSYGIVVRNTFQSPGVSAMLLQGQVRRAGAEEAIVNLVSAVRNVSDELTPEKLEELRRRLLMRRLRYLTTDLNVAWIALELELTGLNPTEPDSWSYPVVSVADCQRVAKNFLMEAAPSIVALTSSKGFAERLKAALEPPAAE